MPYRSEVQMIAPRLAAMTTTVASTMSAVPALPQRCGRGFAAGQQQAAGIQCQRVVKPRLVLAELARVQASGVGPVSVRPRRHFPGAGFLPAGVWRFRRPWKANVGLTVRL
ncbi:hypothetical protein GCM10010287_20190 [Streptomyces variabilis]|uniref:Uncharacterized protein n=1 Tax=Streptomyces variabilis TaxID=67372 RepID=A0ABQ2TZF3_9ACTN|nr:hypothetical protein GCM10010265_34060 [Streptomyces griseoincarnatus]GGT46560.1 hypothetical protein GCM10010287_20190 [Streptomyces variabilis]